MIIYNKTIWENNKTPINADNLQKIEDGIEYLFDINRGVPEAENLRVQAEVKREQQEGLRKSNEVDRNRKVNESISKMESISSSIQTNIANKVKEVDSKLNNKISEADNKILDIEDRFLYLTSSQQQSAEVLDARLGLDGTRYTSLKERIDSIETSPYILFEEVEG